MPKTQADGVYRRKDRNGYWIQWRDVNGRRRIRKADAPTLQQARAALAEEKRKVEQARVLGFTPPGPDSFEDVALRYLTRQRATLSPGSYVRADGEFRNHLLPAFRGRPVASIRKADIEGYVAARVGAKAEPATVHKELVTLKHMLRMAVEWEIIPFSPAQTVKGPKPAAGRLRYLHPGELRVLVTKCPAWLRGIVMLAACTGMRRGEILGLRWMDVDLSNGRLILPQTKNGDARIVYLNQTARAVLDARRPTKPTPAVCVFKVRNAQYVRVAFERARKRAKIEDFHFHDLRHTAASWMRMRGADIHTVAQLLGHRDLRMAMRYQHLSPGFLAQAVGKLDGVFGGASKPALKALPAVKIGKRRSPGATESLPPVAANA